MLYATRPVCFPVAVAPCMNHGVMPLGVIITMQPVNASKEDI